MVMLISRVLEVQDGDAVAAVRRFLVRLLEENVAERIFAPVDTTAGHEPHAQVVPDRDAVQTVNPLLPLMMENAAEALRQAMALESNATFAAVLRPCEVRAVIELAKRGRFDLGRLVIVGMDCLATYDADFYHEVNASHPDDPYWMMHEALRFAQKGQIAPYRYRIACQLCERPAADYQAVDVMLGVIGVDAREKILVLADERSDVRLKLHKVTDRKATEREAVEREVALWRLAERRKEAATRKLEELGLTDANMGVIMGYMSKCTLCGNCVEACPLCTDELNEAFKQGKEAFITSFVNQSERLASCAACGMCQVHCPENIPLCAINRALSQQIQTRMRYVPGRSADEPLPWTS
jgi:formate dehydrogenase subunit beta